MFQCNLQRITKKISRQILTYAKSVESHSDYMQPLRNNNEYHAGRRPYKCNRCSLSFHHEENLISHHGIIRLQVCSSRGTKNESFCALNHWEPFWKISAGFLGIFKNNNKRGLFFGEVSIY